VNLEPPGRDRGQNHSRMRPTVKKRPRGRILVGKKDSTIGKKRNVCERAFNVPDEGERGKEGGRKSRHHWGGREFVIFSVRH